MFRSTFKLFSVCFSGQHRLLGLCRRVPASGDQPGGDEDHAEHVHQAQDLRVSADLWRWENVKRPDTCYNSPHFQAQIMLRLLSFDIFEYIYRNRQVLPQLSAQSSPCLAVGGSWEVSVGS